MSAPYLGLFNTTLLREERKKETGHMHFVCRKYFPSLYETKKFIFLPFLSIWFSPESLPTSLETTQFHSFATKKENKFFCPSSLDFVLIFLMER
jgi:hypothetical protein